MLKYPVYVRSITNLSDARYCAGMGVDMIGFCFDPSGQDYVEPIVYQGIAGWVSGVKIVAEYVKHPEQEEIEATGADFAATESEFSIGQPEINIPVIYNMDIREIAEILPPKGSYILLKSSSDNVILEDYADFITNICPDYKVILAFGFDHQTIDSIYETYKPYGFSLKGGNEIAPGLKTFDELAEILEAIEQ